MGSLATSLALGLRQLADSTVLRILLKSLGVTIIVFLIVATGGWFALDWLLAWGGLEDSLFTGAGAVRGAVSALLAVVGLWLTWRIVAMAVIQFYADEVVQAVEARHYPQQAELARDLPFAEQMRNALSASGRALLANLVALPLALILLFTGIGTFALFLLVNAVLLGRELQDMVWLRHCHSAGDCAPVSRAQRFLLGGVIAAMLAVPFANFLAPVLGAASATHLVHRNSRNRSNP
ncbi:EI24 domain-containing protein [Aurantiacibacter odishensis]|uniref:EI24 domain-containing protein n=1 Tax=Aurantiacibacter odishensis TaxID=1155476 RepID=UPI000E70E201|nr:EI24 domain-containing protein [Aurantiacibacter odishensis]